jgi:hypothetical protein
MLALVLTATLARSAFAVWPNDPTVNLPLCAAGGDQAEVASVSDGAGGILSVWRDTRSGTGAAIYVQRATGSGNLAPGWPGDGVAACLTSGDRFEPVLASDGNGGAILAWTDGRAPATGNRIYAQHVQAAGTVDPAWPANGLLLASVTGDQSFPVLVSDGAGGAIVAWSDQRAGNADVYAHHVLANGTLDAVWPATGRAVAASADASSPGSPATAPGGQCWCGGTSTS